MKRIIIFAIFLLFSFVFGVSARVFDYEAEKDQMIQEQIIDRGVTDTKVISAMKKVERHLFVPDYFRLYAYEDGPLPIGHEQTISQPYIVAFMTEALELSPFDVVLEIGTGSGYQAAILAEIASEVYSIEIIKPLADQARERLKKLGYNNIHIKHGNGYLGWPENTPFDKIIVTAAPEEIPMELVRQLKVGGKMVVPIGSSYQELYLIIKTEDSFTQKSLLPVTFVPMVSED